MTRKWRLLPAAGAVAIGLSFLISGTLRSEEKESDVSVPCTQRQTHDVGKVAFTITNWCYLGGIYDWWGWEPPVPRCRYPKNTGIEYLWHGALWVGGVIGEDTLVSVGLDGWYRISEMNPDICPGGEIVRRGPGDPRAISDVDYVARFCDTLVHTGFVSTDPYDRRPHVPLNIEITQTSMSWATTSREDFILFEYIIKNVGITQISDAWVGIYMDGDVYSSLNRAEEFTDDLAGYLSEQDIAYMIDNDGDPWGDVWHREISPQAAMGVKLLHSQPAVDRINFNWWCSSGDPRYDFGPRQVGSTEDPFRDFGTDGLGTPQGDRNKYYILSHDEKDYDQLRTASFQSSSGWKPVEQAGFAENLADGFDTKFLYSFGPFDIAPRDSVRFWLTVVMGDRVHAGPHDFRDYFDPNNPQAYYDLLDFTDLIVNARMAEWLVTGGLDMDGDGVGHGGDNCPNETNPDQEDADGDGWGDVCDNCPCAFNHRQEDFDEDGIGDSCEVRRTWYVKADRTGDAPTIQAAIDSSFHGDTVLVAMGTYSGEGNWAITPQGKQILIKSENGPGFTTIDCSDIRTGPHRGFVFQNGEDSRTVVDGFTIYRGDAMYGGGMLCSYRTSPLVANCIFTENKASLGGGVYCRGTTTPEFVNCVFINNAAVYTWHGNGGGMSCVEGSSPQLENCVFYGNTALNGGGAMSIEGYSSPLLDGCLFRNNVAEIGEGGAIYLQNSSPVLTNCTLVENLGDGISGSSSSPVLENCIIAFNGQGSAIDCSESSPTLSCCDLYGNAEGDWEGSISDQAGINGNFSEDPLFCNIARDDFNINAKSPCVPRYNSCGVQIGAYGIGCGCDCSGIGDCDNDGLITATDVVYLIDYLYLGGPPPPIEKSCPVVNRGDFDCDGRVSLVDVVALVLYIHSPIGAGPCDPCQ